MAHDVIDNSGVRLAEVLRKKLEVSNRARFATGWFFLTGLKEIKKELESLDEIQILVGSKTNKQTAEAMLLGQKYEEAVKNSIKQKKRLPPQEIKKILETESKTLISHISTIKPTEENIEFVKWFWEKLRKKKIQIRIYPHETLHAKLYLLDYKDTRHGSGIAYVGSSNLSMSGFNLNTELNVAVHGEKNHDYLGKWFDGLWDKSEKADFTILAEKAIRKSWVLNEEVTPFRVYLRILHEIFTYGDYREVPETSYGNEELWDYQKDAVIDAYRRLHEYDGVFIADVPGLGKTYMGAALLAHLQEEGERAIVVCPPKLVEQWEEVLSQFWVGTARVFSHGKLEEIINNENLLERKIVLIDESHHFRNPETNRYQDMELICEGKKVILLGATPQNLSVMDLYHQIKLFTPSEANHKFRIDPVILKDYFKAAEKGKTDIEDLISQIIIRRTRSNILDEYGKGKLPKFPERKGPVRIDYSIDKVYTKGLYKELNRLIDKLKFARYDLGNYLKEEAFTPDERQRIRQAGKNLRKIMRMILFRRLESSVAAFQDSSLWMYKTHVAFLASLGKGQILAGDAADEAVDQLKAGIAVEELDVTEGTYNTSQFKTEELREAIMHDEGLFEEMYALVKNIAPEQDDKLQTLIKKLKDIGDKKVIIFTQFSSTAKYLGKELSKHFNKVDYVSGDTGKVMTKAKRFSPNSNRIKVKPDEEIDLLISTELLSEGLNLQDGQVIINYELHWNPVRIIQRIGRIDRIGSEHDEIWVYNFFPQEEAEKEINVETKVKKRINEIIKIYGADTKTITEDEKEVRKNLFEVYTEKEESLEEKDVESKSGYFRLQWTKLKKDFPKEYRIAVNLPDMVFSGIKSEEERVAVFARADDYFRLMLSSNKGNIINRNDWEILPLIECKKDKKMQKPLVNHFRILEDIRRRFEQEANRREIERKEFLGKIKEQLLQKLNRTKRGKSERFKKQMEEICSLLRQAKLDIKRKRKLRSIRKKHGLSANDLLQEVKEALKETKIQKPPKPRKKYAQVIVSESLVAD